MARSRAAIFDEQREKIAAAAAELMAKNGFLGTSTADIAASCNMHKSMIHYYFSSKEDILFAVMWGHVRNLAEHAKTLASRKMPADEQLRWLARILMEAYSYAPAWQKILMNEIDNLTPEKRAVIMQAQRDVIDVADKYVAELSYTLRNHPKQRVPYVMMYFGMLNWTHTWFDRAGPITIKTVADIAADIFLKGLPR
jgi:AcrR family transcriptional regulator